MTGFDPSANDKPHFFPWKIPDFPGLDPIRWLPQGGCSPATSPLVIFTWGLGLEGFHFRELCFFRLEIFVLDFCFTASMLFYFSLLTCSLLFCVFLLFCFSFLLPCFFASAFPCFSCLNALLPFPASMLTCFSLLLRLCPFPWKPSTRFVRGWFRVYLGLV